MGILTGGARQAGPEAREKARQQAAERFDEARRSDLPLIASKMGYKLKKEHGNKYSSNRCPSCGEGREAGNAVSFFIGPSGYWRWKCFCCPAEGTAIDFVAMADEITDREAVSRLLSDDGDVFQHTPVKRQQLPDPMENQNRAAALKRVIEKIKVGRPAIDNAVSDYLLSRRISVATQRHAFDLGQLRTLPEDPREAMRWLLEHVGEQLLVESGLLSQGNKWSAICFRPLVSILPGDTSIEFRVIRDPNKDEPKAIRYGAMQWPWWWTSRSGIKPTSILAVEGLIDLWSCVEMGAERKYHIAAFPGVRTWNAKALAAAARKYKCNEIAFGFDRDETGDLVEEQCLTSVRELGLIGVRITPKAKDWNKQLIERK